MTLVGQMSEFVSSLRFETIPDRILDGARDRLLDALSTSLGSRSMAATQAVVNAVTAGLPDAGQCTVLPTGGTAGAQDAALINGTAVHAILYEDYHLTAADHPGASIVPAALAAAESATGIREGPVTIGDLLVAIVAGYEVQVKLGLVAAEGIIARKFRTTGILGTVSASAAAASAYGLAAPQAANALAMGANMASGFLEGFAHGTMEPYIHAGISARNGVLAARLGYAGILTASLAFEGPAGYFAVFAGLEPAEYTFPAEWMLTRVAAKPYPLSGGKTSTVDSALALMDQGVRAEDVERVVVRLPQRTKIFPGSDFKGPFTSMYQAQDSTQFIVAAVLLGRPMKDLRTVKDGFADQDIFELAQRIEVVGEEGRMVDGKILSTVEVTLRDGRTLISEVDRADQHAPTVASMAAKLRLLAEGTWPDDQTEQVIELILGDPTIPVANLSAALVNRR